MAKPKTQSAPRITIQERIEKRRELQTRLQALKNQHQESFSAAHSARITANEAREKARGFCDSMSSRKDIRNSSAAQNTLTNLLQEADKAKAEADIFSQRESATDKAINQVEAEIAALTLLATVDDVKQYQEEVAKAERTVKGLSDCIAEQEKMIIAVTPAPLPIPELRRRHEDMLAGLALGDVTEGEVRQVAEDIERLEKEAAEAEALTQEIIPKIEATIAGLRRKQTEALARVTELQGMQKDVVAGLLRFEAEALCLEYVNLASQMADMFNRLLALKEMQQMTGCNGPICFKACSHEILIPGFNLAACEGRLPPHQHGFLVKEDGRFWSNICVQFIAAEQERLRGLGVTIL